MGHPVARLHQRRPLADHREGELDPVGRGAEPDLLLQVDGVGGGHARSGAIHGRDREDVHRPRDVLQGARAQRLELRLERPAHLVEHLPGDADATRLRDTLEPGRDVDAVTVDPGLVVDDVAQVDADAEEHAARLGYPLVAGRHDGLDLDRALGRVDHAGELGQDAVARGVDDAAAVAADQRQDHRLVPLEVADRRGLVLPHEPAVAGDVGREDGGEPALDRGRGAVVRVRHLFLPRDRGREGPMWPALWHIAPGTARAYRRRLPRGVRMRTRANPTPGGAS